MAEYRLSPAAERDLEGIWKYTREEWGLEQAERYNTCTPFPSVPRVTAKSHSGCAMYAGQVERAISPSAYSLLQFLGDCVRRIAGHHPAC
jgi:hypothetical protein